MDGGLTARKLQKVRLALARHQRIHHPFNLGERPMGRLGRRTVGKANRTSEVARFIHINERKARMLLMIRAKPAIIGAAKLRAGLHLQRPVAGLQVIMAELVVSRVRRNQRLLNPVGFAALQVIDIVILNDDLGRHQGIAGFAERCGLPVKNIGRNLTNWPVHYASSSSRHCNSKARRK